MKLLTARLEGRALDWALAKAKGADDVWVRDGAAFYRNGLEVCAKFGHAEYEPFNHADHSVCLDSIKSLLSHGVSIQDFALMGDEPDVLCEVYFKPCSGKTLEQAVARCVVAMQLGDEVDVPDCLIGDLK